MLTAYLSLLFLCMIWGFTFPVVQRALSDASPLVFLTLRFGISALLFALMIWPHVFKISRQVLWKGTLLGVLLWVGYFFQTIGLNHTTAARSGFITGLLVPMTPIFAWIMFRERISLRLWTAVLIAFVGMAVMSSPESGGFNRGDFYTLVCAVSFAVQVACVGQWANQTNERGFTLLQLAVTSLLSLFMIPSTNAHLDFSPFLIFALFVTAVFGSLYGVWAQLRFQPKISAAAAAVIYATEPIFAGLAAWIMLDETPPPATQYGAALIILGMILSSPIAKKETALA